MTITTFLQNLILYKHKICDVVHLPASTNGPVIYLIVLSHTQGHVMPYSSLPYDQ